MTIPEFGNLEEVDLRQAWPHEAQSFTPWLSENLEMLSAAIGIPLELEGQEVAVQQFSADILARNPRDDSRVFLLRITLVLISLFLGYPHMATFRIASGALLFCTAWKPQSKDRVGSFSKAPIW